jgi:protein SCO1/2
VDQRGHSFTLASLHGEPLAVTFISAHCTDACPLINAQFSDAARRIAQAHMKAKLVTITLDPEHDSLATMGALAKRFDADPHYWLVAGGSTPNVEALMRTFGVLSVEGKRGYRDEHTTYVYILNGAGAVAQTMLASSALSDAVVDALRGEQVAAR